PGRPERTLRSRVRPVAELLVGLAPLSRPRQELQKQSSIPADLAALRTALAIRLDTAQHPMCAHLDIEPVIGLDRHALTNELPNASLADLEVLGEFETGDEKAH